MTIKRLFCTVSSRAWKPSWSLLSLGVLVVGLARAASALPETAHDPESAAEPSSASGHQVSQTKLVKVTTRREGKLIRFFVENNERCEVTMTFDLALVNLTGPFSFPHTAVFPARKVTEAFALSPTDPSHKWEYSFTNCFKLGSYLARHDDSFVYELPYKQGERYKVTQSANGSYSHTGSNKYAVDWKMAEGTIVHAARGGWVVKTKEDSDTGGPSMDYDCYNNYVLVRHDDGTLGHYCHLQKGGCLVEPGQVIVAGQAIARSGNTGFSSGAHLHFCVFQTRSGKERVSVPIQFRTSSEEAVSLYAGRSYRAAPPREAKPGALTAGIGRVADPGEATLKKGSG